MTRRYLGAVAALSLLAACQAPAAGPQAPERTISVVGRLAPAYALKAMVGRYELTDVGSLEIELFDVTGGDVEVASGTLEGPITGATPIKLSGLKLDREYRVVLKAYALDDTTPLSVDASSETEIDTTRNLDGEATDELAATFALTLINRDVRILAHLPVTFSQAVDEVEVQLEDDQSNVVIPGVRTPVAYGAGTYTFDLRDLRPNKDYHVFVKGYSSNVLVTSGDATFTAPGLADPMDDETTLSTLVMGGP